MVRKNNKPTSSRRAQKQKVKERYARAREDAQLLELIPTVPEGALKEERVDPSSQDEQRIPELDRKAIMRGWAVPDDEKELVINRLLEPFHEEKRRVITKDGSVVEVDQDRDLLQKNAKVLIAADKHQYERDNPEEAGKARGSAQVNVNSSTQVNVLIPSLKELFDRIDAQENSKLPVPVVVETAQTISKNGSNGDQPPIPAGDEGSPLA